MDHSQVDQVQDDEREPKQKIDFASFLLSIPKVNLEDWEIARDDSDPGREIDLGD